MEVRLTPEQRQAVEHRGGPLIVSAAAGSGKTAVLVRRVIGLLCDPERPVDVDRLLVVTYTNAAAAEMRAKIAAALLERLADEPENLHLIRQLALLPGARIQTVHAFCLDLIRQNFSLCGVPPDFGLADETQCALLKDAAMDELLEARYEQGAPGFTALCDALCEERGDRRLAGAVLAIYEQLRSHPDPEGWLRRTREAEALDGPIGDTPWGGYLLQNAQSALVYALGQMEQADDELQADPVFQPKYQGAVRYCLDFGARLLDELRRGAWDSCYELLEGYAPPRFGVVKNGDEQFKARMKACKDRFGKCVKQIRKESITAPEQALMEENRRAQPLASELCGLVEDFTVAYQKQKSARNLLDFSDLEHLALGLLRTGEGEKTPLAQELSGRLAEVLVDEYQDTNAIQDAIFASVAPESGAVFLVGDVKQSIYRFRLAEPRIFVDKYLSAADLGQGDGGGWRRLALNRNFRSRPQVLALCNWIFSRTMSRDFGEIDYDERERLYPGASYPGDCPSEAYVLDLKEVQAGSDEEDAPERAQAEADFVAARLSQLLATMQVAEGEGFRPARPGDFAILLSSFTSKAPYYEKALGALRIPCAAAKRGGDFYQSMEVQIMLSLLRVIDNRRQDVPLISVMRSPLYFFTPDELAEIRLCDREGSYFDALCAAADAGHQRAAALLSDLREYTALACDYSTAELLQYIYGKTGATGVFSTLDNGDRRRKNLTMLYEMALGFESAGPRGIFAFLQYIDRRIEAGSEGPDQGQAADAVQIMSIHRSKGLEFPVVFVCDLSKGFNEEYSRAPVLFHEKLGIGVKLREPGLQAEFKTQGYWAVVTQLRRELRAEELRKLYVALTRAKEKLILVASYPDADKRLSALAATLEDEGFAPERLAAQTKADYWVLGPLMQHPAGGPLRDRCGQVVRVCGGLEEEGLRCAVLGPYDLIPAPYRPQESEERPLEGRGEGPDRLALADRAYAHELAASLPSKLTPTGLRRLDPEAGEAYEEDGKPGVRPYHWQPMPRKERLGAAGRGTALHLFLQHCDYARCAQESGLDEEIRRLTQSGHLSDEQGESVDGAMLERFFHSEIARRAAAAGQVLREYEFGALFTPDELLHNGVRDEWILMNGTIDLLLAEGDGLTVVDFKSDRVRPGQEPMAAERHRMQLEIYAAAAGKIFERPVREKLIYFIKTGAVARL